MRRTGVRFDIGNVVEPSARGGRPAAPAGSAGTRRHLHVSGLKQQPNVSLRQPHPGVLEWTLPTGPTSGRTYVVRSDPVTDGQLPELGMSLDNPQDEDGPLLYEQDLLDVVPPWMDIDEWLDQTTLSPSEIALALAN